MPVQKMFRTHIGGFHKDDVNNYIKETDLKHTEELELLRKEIADLEEKANEATALREELEHTKAQMESSISSLEEMLALAESEKSELKKSLSSQDEQLNTLSTELADTRKSMGFYKGESESQLKVMAGLKEELRAKDSAISSLEESALQLRAQLSEQTAALEQMIADNAVLEKQAAELREQMQQSAQFSENADDKNSPAYKIGMYDKISSQLGDILINANRNADDILANAKSEAERYLSETALECEQKRSECNAVVSRIKAETEEEAAYIRERLSQTANELLSTVSQELHGSIENCVREINTGFTDMQYEFATLLSKITNRSNEMNDRVNYYQSCVSDSIEDKLSAMDEKYGIRKPGADSTDNA